MWLAERGLSEHLTAGWRGQLARVQRWHRRVQKLGSGDDTGPTTSFDDLYAFFLNCFQLRDWLEKAEALTASELQGFMTDNLALGVCRDIANITKHFRLKSPSFDPMPSIGREYHDAGTPGKRPGTIESYFAIIEDRTDRRIVRFDLQDLADECVSQWLTLLHAKGLVPH